MKIHETTPAHPSEQLMTDSGNMYSYPEFIGRRLVEEQIRPEQSKTFEDGGINRQDFLASLYRDNDADTLKKYGLKIKRREWSNKKGESKVQYSAMAIGIGVDGKPVHASVSSADLERFREHIAQNEDWADLHDESAQEMPQNELAREIVDAQDLATWIEGEERHGSTVDAVNLPIIETAEYMTSEQAVEYVADLANRLQDMLLNPERSIARPRIWDEVYEFPVESIIGKGRSKSKTAYVSSHPIHGSLYSFAKETQDYKFTNGLEIVALSPAENLERLLRVAHRIWDAPENQMLEEEAKRELVREVIANNPNDATNFQGGWWNSYKKEHVKSGVDGTNYLSSGVARDSQVYVGYTEMLSGAGSMFSVEKREV